MKQSYHIKVGLNEKEYLERALKQLGVEASFVSTLSSQFETVVDYIVELSKYEFLYISLMCKTGKVVKVPERNKKYENVLHTSSEIRHRKTQG